MSGECHESQPGGPRPEATGFFQPWPPGRGDGPWGHRSFCSVIFCPSPGLEWLEIMLTTPLHKRGLV